MAALERPGQSIAGHSKSMHAALGTAIRSQHGEHPSWSYQLHYETLVARAKSKASSYRFYRMQP